MNVRLSRSQGAWTVSDPDAPRALILQVGLVEPVWKSKAGLFTGFIKGEGCYAKFAPHRTPPTGAWSATDANASENSATRLLRAEAERLAWMSQHNPAHPTPRIVRLVSYQEGVVLVTNAIKGIPASAAKFRNCGDTVAVALATGLRVLHALPLTACPFDWTAQTRLAAATGNRIRIPRDLRDVPETDHEVLSHGEAFLPNLLISDSGTFAGHVDLARLGRADRWADLAAAVLSLEWNFSNPALNRFWETYGLAPDERRLKYYKALWRAIEAKEPSLSSSATLRSTSAQDQVKEDVDDE